MKIIVRPPSEEEKQEAETWGIWTKEPSSFPWSYDVSETCLVLEGQALITTEEIGRASCRERVYTKV